MLKNSICTITGITGAMIAHVFGGWSAGLTTLCVFMAIDYVSGLTVAGVFGASSKTENGGLESRTALEGIIRKAAMLVIVAVAHRLDLLLGAEYLKDAVIIAFCTSELISLVENAGLMGVPIPAVIRKAIDVLKEKEDRDGSDR